MSPPRPFVWLHATREALAAAHRVFTGHLALHNAASHRERRRQQRLRSMTDVELLKASTAWGGASLYPELRRRGLPLPGTHADP